MIEFSLDPPSGYADSYLDVKFIVQAQEVCDKIEIELWNLHDNVQIEIFAVVNGSILNESVAVFQNTKKLEGYCNVFNKDKMNSNLANISSVDIECRATVYQKDIVHKCSKISTFYNQSKSLDWNITPFDLALTSHVIDVKHQSSFSFYVISDIIKRYELCIMSKNQIHKCTLEIMTKPGKMLVNIPVEILWWDLKANQVLSEYDIYWVKFEGVTYNRFMNRRYVIIPNTTLKFNQKELVLTPTTRLSPTNSELSDDFVLSDRYFVHTWHEFSGIGKINESFGSKRLHNFSRFFHEAQNMQSLDALNVSSFSAGSKKPLTAKEAIRQASFTHHSHQTVRSSTMNQKQQSFLKNMSTAYKKPSHFVEPFNQQAEPEPSPAKKTGGCGCARKKNAQPR